MDDFVINRADEYGRSIYLRDRPASGRSVVFTGAPGTGKSFVLRHAAEQARADGDLVIKLDASSRESLQSRMTRSIGDQLDQLKDQTPFGAGRLLRRLRKTLDTMLTNRFDIQHAISGSLSWWPPLRLAFTHGRDQQFERPTSSVNDLADRLGDLAEERGRRVIVLIDNLDQAGESDLATINELAVHLEQGDRPVNLNIAASQPALDRLLVAAMPEGLASDAARCYEVRTCGPIPDAELRPAVTARIARSGTAVLPEAADQLVAEANGDPGRLLRLADRATDLAVGPDGVTTDTATAAVTRLRQEDAWIYNAGWNNLTGRAKAILADAAADPDGSKISALNKGLDPDEWAERDAARSELIGAGLVRQSDDRLVVADPGMRQWIADHTGSRPSLRPSDKATRTDRATAGSTRSKTNGKTAAKTASKPTTSKRASKPSAAKKSPSKTGTGTTSSSKKSASKTSAKKTAKKKSPAAKGVRPPSELHAAQPSAVRAINTRRATSRTAGEPTGRAS